MDPAVVDQRVFTAADALLARGVKPSRTKVRDEMGGGSYRDIVPALKRYWERRQEASPTPLPMVTAAPTAIAPAGDMVPRTELEAAVRAERERAEEERRYLMGLIDKRAQESVAPLRGKIERLEDENGRLNGDLYLAKERIAVLERQVR